MRNLKIVISKIKDDLVEYIKYAKDSKEECYKLGIIIIAVGLIIGR